MKDLHLAVWLTQLGLSVAVPMAGFPLLAIWLRNRFAWGNWVIWVGVIFGLISAIDGFRHSLRLMKQMSKKDDDPPPPSFNEHE